MSHNATGYDEDMNPDLIDGIQDPRPDWAKNDAKLALRARRSSSAWTRAASSTTTPRATWARCTRSTSTPTSPRSRNSPTGSSTGPPRASSRCSRASTACRSPGTGRCTAAGTRASASSAVRPVPWEFCLAEWNAQFLGDRAYRISEAEKENLRWEAKQFRAGNLWHRWDYPAPGRVERLRRPAGGDRPVHHRQLACPPHLGRLGELAVGIRGFLEAARRRGPAAQGLQGGLGEPAEARVQPGLRPAARQGLDERGRRALGLGADGGGQALLRNNRPLLAYIGGKPAASRARTTTSVRAKRSRSSSSSSTTRAKPCRATAGGRLACLSPIARRARGSPSRRASRSASRCASSCRPRWPPASTSSPRPFASATGRRRRTRSRSTSCRARPTLRATLKIALFDPKGETSQAARRGLGVRLPARRGRRGPVRLRHADRRQGGADARTGRAGRRPRARRAEGHRVRADRRRSWKSGSASASRSTACGRSSRACPIIRCWPGSMSRHLRDWRGEATILPPRLKYTIARLAPSAPRSSGAASTCRACLALRLSRQRGLGADREAGARRFPADPRRRLQPPVQPAPGVPRRQGDGAVLPDGRDRTHRERSGGRHAGP